jgi:hypothetical protein
MTGFSLLDDILGSLKSRVEKSKLRKAIFNSQLSYLNKKLPAKQQDFKRNFVKISQYGLFGEACKYRYWLVMNYFRKAVNNLGEKALWLTPDKNNIQPIYYMLSFFPFLYHSNMLELLQGLGITREDILPCNDDSVGHIELQKTMFLAAKKNNMKIMQLVIQFGGDNFINKEKKMRLKDDKRPNYYSCLSLAAYHRNKTMVAYLIDCGADIINGLIPLALTNRRSDYFFLLKEYIESVNIKATTLIVETLARVVVEANEDSRVFYSFMLSFFDQRNETFGENARFIFSAAINQDFSSLTRRFITMAQENDVFVLKENSPWILLKRYADPLSKLNECLDNVKEELNPPKPFLTSRNAQARFLSCQSAKANNKTNRGNKGKNRSVAFQR